MNNTSDDQSCSLAHEILTTNFKALVAAEITVAIAALTPNALLLSAVLDVTVLPPNLRLILGHFSFVLVFFSLGTIAKGFYFLTTPSCAFDISFRACRFFDLATSGLALPNIYYSIFSLCIERLYATLNYRKYDKNQKPYLAVFLIVCSWVTCFSVNASNTFSFPTDRFAPFCESTFVQSLSSPYIMPTYLALEWLGGFVTVFIYFYNRYVAKSMLINRAQYDLSARFLIDQNVQINALVLPSMVLHIICHLPTLGLLVPVGGLFGADWASVSTKVCLIRSTYLWRLVYAVMDPMIAFRFNIRLRRHLVEGPFGRLMKKLGIKWGKEAAVEVEHIGLQQVVHFDYLNKLWSGDKRMNPIKVKTVWH